MSTDMRHGDESPPTAKEAPNAGARTGSLCYAHAEETSATTPLLDRDSRRTQMFRIQPVSGS